MLPNFLVVGTSRAGTTSLHHYLGQHPDVLMASQKEPNYFSFPREKPLGGGPGDRWLVDQSVFDPSEYEALFDAWQGERAVGEVSPRYLSSPECPARVAREIPDVRIIVMLRQPAEAAHADFQGHLREGWESNSDLMDAVADEPRRVAEGWLMGKFFSVRLYSQHLERWMSVLPRARIQIHLFEEFCAAPDAVLARIFEFIGVDPEFRVDRARHFNETGTIANPLLRVMWRHSYSARLALRSVLPREWRDRAYARIVRDVVKTELDPDTRARLTELYRSDIERLSALIGRDLSHWFESA